MSAMGRSSIKLDFSNVPVRPSTNEVIEFAVNKLGLVMDQVKRIHLRTSSVCCHVDLKDQSYALDLVEKNDGKHSILCKGTNYPIPVTMDDGSTIVKIHDVSERVTNTVIKCHMQQYGEVISVTEGVWSDAYACAGLPMGYRYVRMIIHKQIPSYMRINGESTLATHRGQQHTCRKCDLPVHHGMTCVSSRKLTTQKSNLNDRLKSYADVTTNGHDLSTVDNVPKTTNTSTSKEKLEPQPGTSGLQCKPANKTKVIADTNVMTVNVVDTHTPNQVENINNKQRSRSSSVKRQADKKLTDFITIESKRGRTRYATKTTTPENGKGRKKSV